jgi:hypothetical protein
MKTDISAFGIPNLKQQQRPAARGFASICTGCVSTVYKGLANFVTNLQIGRMETFLRTMSDEQLAQIGISRSGIKRHAKLLVSYEYDGL